MQIMFDTATEKRASFYALIALLQSLAPLAELADVPTDTAAAALVPPPPSPLAAPGAPASPAALSPAPPVVTAAPTPASDAANSSPAGANDAAAIFGASNVPPPPPTVIPPPPAPANNSATLPGADADATAGSTPHTLDSSGLPWDARIHAESKAKKADGTWRTRRNLKPGVAAAVEVELRAKLANDPVVVPPPPPPGAAVPPPPPPVMVPPPPPPAAADVLPGNGSQPVTFPDLMQRITPAMNDKKLTKPQLDEALASVGFRGVGNVTMLTKATPDQLAAVSAFLNRWQV